MIGRHFIFSEKIALGQLLIVGSSHEMKLSLLNCYLTLTVLVYHMVGCFKGCFIANSSVDTYMLIYDNDVIFQTG